MKRGISILALGVSLVVVGLAAPQALAYVHTATGNDPQPLLLRWATDPTYRINNLTAPTLPNMAAGSDPATAIGRAFETWEKVPSASIGFTFGGVTGITNVNLNDSTNVITFVDDDFQLGQGTLAVTIVEFSPSTGVIQEADMVFNPAVQWSTNSPGAGVYDVEQIATHEAGHFHGQGHSAIHSATMFPFSRPQSQLERRLDPDDIAAISETYPNERLARDFGSIEGTVTRLGAAVFGAQVVAVDGNGRAVAAAMSTKDGSYTIAGLAPGSYEIYVEPLDGPVVQGNIGSAATFWGSPAFTTSFRATLLAGTNQVVAGQATTGVDVAVNNSAQTVNPVLIGLQSTSGGGFSADSIQRSVLQGQLNTWNVAIGGSGMGAPATFFIAGPGVSRVGNFGYGTFSDGTPFAIARFDFAADALATPRVVVITRAGETSFFSNIIEILPNPAELTVGIDELLPGAVYLSWYGGVGPYSLRRDTARDFSAPILRLNDTTLNYRDPGSLNDGIDYYYRLDE